jgi:hypothetical protein
MNERCPQPTEPLREQPLKMSIIIWATGRIERRLIPTSARSAAFFEVRGRRMNGGGVICKHWGLEIQAAPPVPSLPVSTALPFRLPPANCSCVAQTGYDCGPFSMFWKAALRYCRRLVARFDQEQIDKFDEATDPAAIERYYFSVKRVLILITAIVAVAVAIVGMVIVFRPH